MTVCAVIPAQIVTPPDTTAPRASDTQLLALKWSTILFWLRRTARLDLASGKNSCWACIQSTTVPMSTVACSWERGTSQKIGKKPPSSCSLGGTKRPKEHPLLLTSTSSGYRTPITVWYVISVTRALLDNTKPQCCLPWRPAASAKVVAQCWVRSSFFMANNKIVNAALRTGPWPNSFVQTWSTSAGIGLSRSWRNWENDPGRESRLPSK